MEIAEETNRFFRTRLRPLFLPTPHTPTSWGSFGHILVLGCQGPKEL